MFFNSARKKSDEELMHSLSMGDKDGVDELYRRYSSRVYRYFLRMLWGDEERSRDFLQDLFLRIIEKPAMFDTSRKFSTWLFSIANNMCKNEYRRQALRISHGQNAASVVSLPQVDEEDEKLILLHRAVQALPDEDKNLYALRYEAETSVEDLAILLDCPVGTVKSRIFYLKKKLSDALKSEEMQKMKYGNTR